jgi:uncharacterized membrane protein
MEFSHRLTVELDAPLERVWCVIADYACDPSWREGVEMRHSPSGMVRDGTTTFESLRMLGSVHHTEAVVHDVVAGRSFCFASRDGRVAGTRELEARGAQTLLTVTLRVQPPAAMALFAPLLGLMFRRRVQRDLQRLRALVAAGGARAA